jgi:hypothetical protein
MVRSGRDLGPILEVLDLCAEAHGHVPARRLFGGLSPSEFLSCLVAVGICHEAGDLAVLADRLFLQLRTDPEQGIVHQLLAQVAESLENTLAGLEPVPQSVP